MTNQPTTAGTFRKVLPVEAYLFRDHLLRLDAQSRRLRFTHSVPDTFIETYALKFREGSSVVYGYFEDGLIRAAGELRNSLPYWGRTAEAAFSVEAEYANSGIGTKLMDLIIRSARNRGVKRLELNCLAENGKMRAIAAKFASDLHIEHGDVTAEIVPKRLDYLSLATEAFEDRLVLYFAALDQHARMVRQAA